MRANTFLERPPLTIKKGATGITLVGERSFLSTSLPIFPTLRENSEVRLSPLHSVRGITKLSRRARIGGIASLPIIVGARCAPGKIYTVDAHLSL
jgi:hypothetical protein